MLFQQSLSGLIKGLRANKNDERKFIAGALDEIKQEVRSADLEVKAGAVLKLTYLDMLGHDMSWAAFPILETASSPRHHLKSIGYLAASQTFTPNTDVLMLTPNLLKKDLSTPSSDPALALGTFARIATPELARDLQVEIARLMGHTRASVRRKAVGAAWKCVELLGEEESGDMKTRFRERLEDDDPGVIAATVNAITELAIRDPQAYLIFAPQLFRLLTSSSNNWMLIKIIKLFASLLPHEPRLHRKLLPPLTHLIGSTSAVSVLYECVHTCIVGGLLDTDNLAETCVEKLAGFLEDSDQNLKYIALLALAKMVPTHAHLLAEHQEMILLSIDDPDISIRMRALELVSAMVTRDNLQSIVTKLLSHLTPTAPPPPSALAALRATTSSTTAPTPTPSLPPSHRLTLTQHILSMCSRESYTNLPSFDWYLSTLIQLAHIAPAEIGPRLREQALDVAVRVRSVRRYAVQIMERLLDDEEFREEVPERGEGAGEMLHAAAWICGEYATHLSSAPETIAHLLHPTILRISTDVQAVCVHAAGKIYGAWTAGLAQEWDDGELPALRRTGDDIQEALGAFKQSADVEVQERAVTLSQLFQLVQADLSSYCPSPTPTPAPTPSPALPSLSPSPSPAPDGPRAPKSLYLLSSLHSSHPLNAVAPRAQSMVEPPEGLDLDAWIVPPRPGEDGDSEDEDGEAVKAKAKGEKKKKKKGSNARKEEGQVEETEEEKAERARRRAARLAARANDPYYIQPKPSPAAAQEDIDAIPVVHLSDLGEPTVSSDPHSAAKSSKTTKKKKLAAAAAQPSPPPPPEPLPDIDIEGELPKLASSIAEDLKGLQLGAQSGSGNETPANGTSSGGTPRTGTPPVAEAQDERAVETGTIAKVKKAKKPKKKREA